MNRTFDKKRNKKQYYKQQFVASKRGEEIKNGQCGFLVTCDQNKEQRCVKELFNLLNDWVEKLYPDIDIGAIVLKYEEEEKEKKKAR